MSRKAKLRHGALVGCITHKKRRTFKSNASRPSNDCLICHMCWLSDKMQTMLYEDDIEDLIRFSNTFKTIVKINSIEYVEEAEDG
jgi:hypothetical protein